MTPLPSLFDRPAERLSRSRARRRTLTTPEPLSEPREPAAFVRAMLDEYAAALSSYRRAKCEAAKVTTSGEERRQFVLNQMDAALTRCAHVAIRLAERCR